MAVKAQQTGLNRRCGPFCGIAPQKLVGNQIDLPVKNRGELVRFSLLFSYFPIASTLMSCGFSRFVPVSNVRSGFKGQARKLGLSPCESVRAGNV